MSFPLFLFQAPVNIWSKSWLIGKDSDAGRDWGQVGKGTPENEMAGWHHGLDGHESEGTPGIGDGQGGLACCNSWGRKESDATERLNWTELNWEPRSREYWAHMPKSLCSTTRVTAVRGLHTVTRVTPTCHKAATKPTRQGRPSTAISKVKP